MAANVPNAAPQIVIGFKITKRGFSEGKELL